MSCYRPEIAGGCSTGNTASLAIIIGAIALLVIARRRRQVIALGLPAAYSYDALIRRMRLQAKRFK